MKTRMASRLASWLVAIALISDAFVAPAGIATAATAPGTQITNNATATYKDAATNVYNTTSNTVTTVVQNAPTLLVLAAAGSAYSPGQQIADTFTITNTGNASGTFQINGNATVNGSGNFSSPADAPLSGTDASFGTLGSTYSVSGCGGAGTAIYEITIPGPSTVDCDTLAHANVYLLAHSIAASAAVTVTVFYTLGTGATAPATIKSSLDANITYAAIVAGGGLAAATAEVSAVTGATENNTVISDAIINQYKAAAQCTIYTPPCNNSLPANDNLGDIQYTISANNAGSQPTADLASVKALFGAAFTTACGACVGGVMIMDKVPTCATCVGTPVLAMSNATGGNATVSVTVSAANGFATNATAFVIYSTSATGATWSLGTGSGVTTGTGTFTVPTASTVYYVGILMVSGTSGGACTSAGELCPGAATINGTSGGATGVDNHAAISYTYSVAQSTLPGSGNVGAYTDATVAAWKDHQPTPHIICPGVPGGTADSPSPTQLTTGTQCINTPPASCPELGCSNPVPNNSIAAYSVLNGPFDGAESGACAFAVGATNCQGADATGTYDGAATNDNTDDFTAIPFQTGADNAVNTGTTLGTPVTATTTSAAFTSACIEHSVFNYGNKNDTFNLAATAVTKSAIPATGAGSATAGWTVTLYSDNLCGTTTSSIAVNSGVGAHYYVKYTAASGQPYFDRFDAIITATSVGNGAKTNTTHDELYSGFIAFTKTAVAASTNCPVGFPALAGSSAVVTCPGGTLSYSMDYRNLVMGQASTNVSFSQCITPVGTLVMTDDGTQAIVSSAALPNWATFTNGLQVAPIDANSNAVARTNNAFTYATAIPAVTYAAFSAGATAFKDTVGGATFQLAPKGYFNSGIVGNPTLPVVAAAAIDWQGTITFNLTVK
jgi:hypothetical protein